MTKNTSDSNGNPKEGDIVAPPEGGCPNCHDPWEGYVVQKDGSSRCYACGWGLVINRP